MWCVAELDEEYIRRMEDVLALYEKPLSEEEPVVCIDEKPVLLHRDIRAPKAARPGHVARRDYEYKRCGTANVFCGVEPKAGRHFPKPAATRSATDRVSASSSTTHGPAISASRPSPMVNNPSAASIVLTANSFCSRRGAFCGVLAATHARSLTSD